MDCTAQPSLTTVRFPSSVATRANLPDSKTDAARSATGTDQSARCSRHRTLSAHATSLEPPACTSLERRLFPQDMIGGNDLCKISFALLLTICQGGSPTCTLPEGFQSLMKASLLSIVRVNGSGEQRGPWEAISHSKSAGNRAILRARRSSSLLPFVENDKVVEGKHRK